MNNTSNLKGELLSLAEDAPNVRLYTHNEYSQYLQMLLTNTCSNTYYVEGKELAKDAVKKHVDMAINDPVFMLQACKYARINGFMRTQPILGMAILVCVHKFVHPRAKDDYERVLMEILITPDDLLAYTGFVRNFRGLGSFPRRVISHRLNKLTDYHTVKYNSSVTTKKIMCSVCGKKLYSIGQGCADLRCRGVGTMVKSLTLPTLIKLVHATPQDSQVSDRFKYLLTGEYDRTRHPDSIITGYLQLKDILHSPLSDDVTDQTAVDIITTYKLPHEVVTGLGNLFDDAWGALFTAMPATATLRNIATAARHNVHITSIKSKLDTLTERSIKVAKVMPLQVYKASEAFSNAYGAYTYNANGLSMFGEIKQTFNKLLDWSLASSPTFEGDVALFLDRSGSMDGEMSEVGALFLLALLKSNPTCIAHCFSTKLQEVSRKYLNDPMTSVGEISNMLGGGTDISLCIRHLHDHRIYRDTIVIITDDQTNMGTDVCTELTKYKAHVNANVRLYLVNVLPYGTHSMRYGTDNVFYVFGWNDQVLNYITCMEKLRNSTTLQNIRDIVSMR